MRVFGPRTILEAAFLVAVPIIALEAELTAWQIIGVSAAAYVLVLAIETTLGRLGAVPSAEPVPSPKPEPAPEPEPPVRVFPAARQWSLWDLERMAREQAGRNTAMDEERTFLLMYMRDFADADGLLPPSFDALVRESFAS
ncbi:MAG TPA: hypothetical protein VM690_06480 [Gaiellaceae bacterium]|nr:hypothetical protein [Gaiellaceae bacterium]